MSEMTITIKVDLPDDVDVVNKVTRLLNVAGNAIAKEAQEEIYYADVVYNVLDNALQPSQRPEEYKQKLIFHYRHTQAWIAARDLASAVMSSALMQVMAIKAD